jgi:hypothetical protein
MSGFSSYRRNHRCAADALTLLTQPIVKSRTSISLGKVRSSLAASAPFTKLATAAMAGVSFVQMSTKQCTTDTAGNGAENTSANRVSKQCASCTTGNRANRSVAAATAVIIISVVAPIYVMAGECGCRKNSRH